MMPENTSKSPSPSVQTSAQAGKTRALVFAALFGATTVGLIIALVVFAFTYDPRYSASLAVLGAFAGAMVCLWKSDPNSNPNN
jgi:hypothetical protein